MSAELLSIQFSPGMLPPGKTFESLVGHSVVNLSDIYLTKHQVEVLEKGLTFCPTPDTPDIVDIWTDLDKFFRRLRLKRHFHDILPRDPEPQHPFRNKSDWNPPENDPILETFIKTVKTELLYNDPSPPKKRNLNSHHTKAIKELRDNKHITIKKADKGSAICIMNTRDYIREAMRQLSNRENYHPLDNDPTNNFSMRIKHYLDNMLENDHIDEACYEYLNIPDPKPGRFYLLPKIHKKGIPGRPICGSNNHPTERISEFVDHHIRKYVNELPSYIRDTQHFIKRLREIGPLPEGCLLVTWDVTSLYTNIPNSEGINASVEKVRNDPTAKLPSYRIGKLLELVLHQNYFEFNNQLYL